MERRAVGRPLRPHDLVARCRPAAGLHQLLKTGLVVLPLDLLAAQALDLPAEQPVHHGPCRLVTAVQEDRGDDRLEAVGQKGFLGPGQSPLGRLSEPEIGPQAETPGDLREVRTADQVPLELGKPSLIHLGKALHEGIGDQEAERRVPEELQRLIVGSAPFLVGVGGMRQGAKQEVAVSEGMTEALLQARQAGPAPWPGPGHAG